MVEEIQPFGPYPLLKNRKPDLYVSENALRMRTPNKQAHVRHILCADDLFDELKQPGVHKFVISNKGEVNLATFNKITTKAISHPVVGYNFDEGVVAAGYITRRFGKVIITNHSMHFRPSSDTLGAAAEALNRLGVQNENLLKVSANWSNPAFIGLKLLKSF